MKVLGRRERGEKKERERRQETMGTVLGSSENALKGGVFCGATDHSCGPCIIPLLASTLGFRPVCLPRPLCVFPAVRTLLCVESMTAKSEPPHRPLCLRGWRRRLPSWHHCRILVTQVASTQGGHGSPMEGRPEALPACRSLSLWAYVLKRKIFFYLDFWKEQNYVQQFNQQSFSFAFHEFLETRSFQEFKNPSFQESKFQTWI